MTGSARRWIVALPVLLGALDLTVVTAVLPAIVEELAIPVPGGYRVAAWLVTGYLTVYAAGVALGGVSADRRGARATFWWATGVFVGGSFLVAVATGLPLQWVRAAVFGVFEARPDPAMTALGILVGARAVQALGAGAVVPAAMAAVSGDGSRRLRDLGFIAGIDMAGWMLGHLYGGLMVQAFDWRVIFWVNIPLGLAAMLLTRRWLEKELHSSRGGWAGAVVGAGGIAMLALAISFTGDSMIRVGLAAFGLLLVWGFFDRLVPPDVLGGDWGASVGNFLLGSLIFIVLAAVPLYVGTILEPDTTRAALLTGLLLSAFTLPMAAAAPLGGRLAGRSEAGLVVGAGLVAVAGLGLCRAWGDAPGTLVPGLLLTGIGFGGLLALPADRLIRRTTDDRGRSAGVVIILRLVGMALGTALLTEWVLYRIPGLSGGAEAIRVGVMGIFDEAFLLAIPVAVLLGVVLLVDPVPVRPDPR